MTARDRTVTTLIVVGFQMAVAGLILAVRHLG